MAFPNPRQERKRPTIPVERLTVGMFVAELDRPWLGTPFALEGMLVVREAQILELRKLCRFVRIDLDKSSPEVRHAFRGAIQEAAERKPGILSGLLGRLKGMVGGGSEERDRPGSDRAAPPEITAQQLRLPDGIELRKYAEPIPLEQARPKAEKAVDRSAVALDTVMNDLRDNVAPDFTKIGDSASALVESMIENPDAMMLVSEMRKGHKGAYERALKTTLNLLALGRHLGHLAGARRHLRSGPHALR